MTTDLTPKKLAILSLLALTACSDGGGANEKPEPQPEGPVKLLAQELVAPDWPDYPTDFEFLPATHELLVLDKAGSVLHYALSDEGTPGLTLLGQFSIPEVVAPLDCGLISITLDPKFSENHYFYLGYCTSETASGVYRYEFTSEDYSAIAKTRAEILSVDDPLATRPWHNVGWIGFAPQKEGDERPLYAFFGDKVRDENGQNTNNLLGTVARIIPQGGMEPYRPAAGNPAETNSGVHAAAYAWGLRSPWRGGFDQFGHVVIGDVGLFDFEEVNVASSPGLNFGWAEAEGPCVPSSETTEDDDEEVGSDRCNEFRDPATYFSHDSGDAFVKEDPEATSASTRVVWVSSAYRREGNDPYGGQMNDRVLFGDTCTGFARSLLLDADGATEKNDAAGHLGAISSVRQFTDGYLYALRMADCTSEQTGKGAFVRLVSQ
ncbi:MAG: PQQ-dependent sugar dehydrogenase [Polyangiaceae bacterium]|nr:PQQ-dependent sugar dehydrogenase [Polyangiaceae bacterium]